MDLTALACRVGTFETVVGCWVLCVRQCPEDWVFWRLPRDVELLRVDDFVSVDDLLDDGFRFAFIHLPNQFQAVIITLFKTLKFLLQLLKQSRADFELVGILGVGFLELSQLALIVLFDLADDLPKLALTILKNLFGFFINRRSLLQHFGVEIQLLLIQPVDGLHVLHALLQDLHLLLELDLLLSLVVRILGLVVFKIRGLLLLLIVLHLQELLLRLLVQLEQSLDLSIVLFEQSVSLAHELGLNLFELGFVVDAHARELELHIADQLIDVVVHQLHLLHVVLVLLLDGLLKLLLQFLLLLNDLLALQHLLLYVLVELFAVFLFFQLLPVPVDLDVLLVGGYHFVLDLVCAFASRFLLLNATLVLNVVRLGFDRSDRLAGLPSDLL